MVKIKKEIIDEVTLMSDPKCDINHFWDIDEIYKTHDDSNNGKKLTISEIQCETSDINNVVLSENEIKHEDENEEEDYGLSHDCPYGNLLPKEDCPIEQSKMARRKFLFSPRHFKEDNEFTFSTSSVKNLTYSKKKNQYIGPVNYNTSSVKKLTYSKKKNQYIGPGNYNIKFFTEETLGLKLSNLSKPLNNSHLPIKARIKNSKIELKQSLSTSSKMNLNSMSVYPNTLTNNTLPTFNSDCWYDPVSDLYIPYTPMLPVNNLLSK